MQHLVKGPCEPRICSLTTFCPLKDVDHILRSGIPQNQVLHSFGGECTWIALNMLNKFFIRKELWPVHCKKYHFVPNRYIYLNQSNVEALQDIYLLQNEFVVAMHNLQSLWMTLFVSNRYIYLVQSGIFCSVEEGKTSTTFLSPHVKIGWVQP